MANKPGQLPKSRTYLKKKRGGLFSCMPSPPRCPCPCMCPCPCPCPGAPAPAPAPASTDAPTPAPPSSSTPGPCPGQRAAVPASGETCGLFRFGLLFWFKFRTLSQNATRIGLVRPQMPQNSKKKHTHTSKIRGTARRQLAGDGNLKSNRLSRRSYQNPAV